MLKCIFKTVDCVQRCDSDELRGAAVRHPFRDAHARVTLPEII